MGVGTKSPSAIGTPRGNFDSSSVAVKRRVRCAVIPGTIREHIALRTFLSEVFGPNYSAKFQASLEDPFYAPHDRLLLRRMGRIIAHVHLTRRTMQFGQLSLPVAGLEGLATEDDCRGQGLGTHLLAAAERKLEQSGALIGLLRTRIPHFFRRTGWALCGRNSHAAANPNQVLAGLLEQGLGHRRAPLMEGLPRRRASRIQVRPWRRWEEDAIARVYRKNFPGSFGPLERNCGYWHWLLGRRGFDQFYVALDGPDLWDLKESSTQVVGYAAVRGEQIVELMAMPGRRKVIMELLARACGDAIEQDQRQIVLCAPPDSPALDFFRGHEQLSPLARSHQPEFCMARLLNPLGLLQKLCPLFTQRAAEAGLARPLELGLLVDGQKYQIDIAGSGRVSPDVVGRNYLRLNVADFTRLLLGQLDWEWAVAEDRVQPSTALAHDAARVLFPPLPYWRPLLDDLLA